MSDTAKRLREAFDASEFDDEFTDFNLLLDAAAEMGQLEVFNQELQLQVAGWERADQVNRDAYEALRNALREIVEAMDNCKLVIPLSVAASIEKHRELVGDSNE